MKAANTAVALLAGSGLLLAAGCESTSRIESVETRGFLSDYEVLREGGEGEASLVYWNDAADFTSYDKILLEPVTVWLGKGSSLRELEPAQRQELADAFYASLHEKLSEDYAIVDAATAGAMRVRVALTEADQSEPVLDTITTFVPQPRVAASILGIASDTSLFVGEASAEGEVRDAVTGELLAAGVDRRAGTKSIGDGTFSSWSDVYRAFDAWAAQFSANLRKRRQPD